METKREKRHRRHKRIRAKVKGTKTCPRFSIFRSSKHLFIQLIDDNQGKTLIGLSDKEIKKKMTKIEKAKQLGKSIAVEALKQGIKKVVFDRGGYKYHGRVKAAAEAARQAGLKF